MKKFLHALSGSLIFIVPLVWGALLVYGNGIDTEFRDFILNKMQEYPVYGAGLGLTMIAVVLIFLGTCGSSRPRKQYLSFESDNGAVSISVSAVRDFIRKLGDEFGAVVNMEPTIRSEKNQISIDLDVKLQTGSRIPDLSQTLQDRVRESIRDGLGIVEVREIKVKIQDIVGAPPPSASE